MSDAPARAPVLRREREGMLRVLGRVVLLFVGSSVLWGTVLFVSLLMAALSDGPSAALARLDPRGGPGLFPWINAACTLLAPLAWASLAVIVSRKRG